MALSSNRGVVRHVGVLYGVGTFAGLSDRELLERFAGRSREAAELAFAVLVERHGPMVLRVCRRIVADPHDAEDAFQAVFLVLVRRAGSVRKRDSLASWLHGVALRVAGAARMVKRRRALHEGQVAQRAGAGFHGAPMPDDLGPIVHEEIGRMPDRFRAPVVLCYLEGRSYEEAARMLGCPVGTVKSRLSAARETLRRRLGRRGVAPAAGAFAALLAGETAAAAVPRQLVTATARGAMELGANPVVLAGTVPAAVAALTEGATGMITWTRLRLTAALLLMVGFGGAGAVVVTQQGEPSEGRPATPAAAARHGEDAPRMTLEQKLNEKISLRFSNTTLKEAIQYLANHHDIKIVLDPRALESRRVTPETRVNLVAQNIRLKTALKLMLKPLGLSYAVDDNVLLINEPAKPEMQTVTYYVGDLVPAAPKRDPGDGTAARRPVDMRPIIDLLTSSVAPGTWSVYDSSDRSRTGVVENADETIGSITPFFLSLSLIVRHTAGVHEEVADRLRQLRLVKFGEEPEPRRRGAAVPTTVISSAANPEFVSRRGTGPRTVYVPRLKLEGVEPSTEDRLNEAAVQALSARAEIKVVDAPEDADFILNWSLAPRVKPAGDRR